jgi:polyphosphate kinase
MARNFFRRVETCFPIEEPELRTQIDQMLDLYWRDNVKAREQGSALTYERRPVDSEQIDAQALFFEQASKPRKPDVDAKPVVLKTSAKAMESRQRDDIGQPA